MYSIEYHKKALKDLEKIKSNKILNDKVKKLVKIIKTNPYKIPPTFEKLSGSLNGLYSRRINKKHRLIYLVDKKSNKIKILRSHYENV